MYINNVYKIYILNVYKNKLTREKCRCNKQSSIDRSINPTKKTVWWEAKVLEIILFLSHPNNNHDFVCSLVRMFHV